MVTIAGLLALPWLIDTQGQLWTAAWRDAAMFISLMGLSLWMLVRRGEWRMPGPAAFALAIAVIPLMQAATGLIIFKGDASLAAGYLATFALAVLLGARLTVHPNSAGERAMLASLLLAGIGSALLMFAQAAGLERHVGFISSPVDLTRLAGNIGQPNNAATLLVCALVSLATLFEPSSLQRKVAMGAVGACLLSALALTQSRAGALAYLIVAIGLTSQAPLVGWRKTPTRLVLLASMLWLLSSWLLWRAAIAAWLPPVEADDRLSGGTRLGHWTVLLQALWDRPWAGWGWQQISMAQAAHVETVLPTGESVQYAHNLILDLALWSGIPLAAATVAAGGMWLRRSARQLAGASQLGLLLCLVAMLVHAMLELPHGYLLFLVPAGLAVGALTRAPMTSHYGRPLAALLTGALVFGGALTAHDFLSLENAWREHRFHEAHIAGYEQLDPVPNVSVLDQLRALVVAVRLAPTSTLTEEDLDLLRRVADRYANWGNLLRLAMAEARVGNFEVSARTLQRLQHTTQKNACQMAARLWRRDMAQVAEHSPSFPSCDQLPGPPLGESGR